MEQQVLKEAVAIASPVITSLVQSYLTPKIKKLFLGNSDTNVYYIPTENNFNEYLNRTFKRLIIANTLADRNSQKLLNDIYIPLTIETQNSEIRSSSKIGGLDDHRSLCEEYGHILITDSAGMGKSTVMKKIFIDLVCGEDNQLGIPIFIELRRLSKEHKLIDEIQKQLDSLKQGFDNTLLKQFLYDGDFVIILDGYDEISLEDKQAVTADIQDFISKASKNKFYLTSRPESGLASFGSFMQFRIKPLSQKEAFQLLRKYDKTGKIATPLIEAIRNESTINDFLANPFLVSLLFCAYEHTQKIPLKKHIFYRQVYNALFEQHDLSKGDSYTHNKHSGLGIDDFHEVLRYIGFKCMQDQKIQFDEDEILIRIKKSKERNSAFIFMESDFLKDLIETVPLFISEGNEYKWAHKSLMEYFAAQFIYNDTGNQKEAVLEKICGSLKVETYINVIDIYSNIDQKTFKKVVVKHYLEQYIAYYEDNYKNKFSPEITEESLKLRAGLGFLCDFYEKRSTDRLNNNKVFDEILAVKPYIELRSTIGNKSFVRCSKPPIKLAKFLKDKTSFIEKRIIKSHVQNDYGIELPYDQLFFLNPTNADSEFNSVESFDNITQYILNGLIENYSINHDEAVSALKKIEAEIKRDEDEDLLSDL